MKDTLEVLKSFKGNSLYREFLYLTTGFFLILLLNWLFKPNPYSYPNWIDFTSAGKAISIATCSYFLARFCNEVGIILSKAFFSLMRQNKWAFFKNAIKEIVDYANRKSTDLIRTRDVNHAELEQFIIDNDGLSAIYERTVQSAILEQIFLGFSLILAITYSPWLLLLTLVLLVKTTLTAIGIFHLKIDAALFLRDPKRKDSKD